MANQKYKIVVLTIPFWGHVFPFSGIAYELASNNNLDVIFYGNKEHRSLIEKTGSIFKEYLYFPTDVCLELFKTEKNENVLEQSDAYFFLNVASKNLMDLVKMIEDEKPDLVLYDIMSFHAKYLMIYLKNRYESRKSTLKPPLSILISTTLAFQDNVYPNKIENELRIYPFKFKTYYYMLFAYLKQLSLWWKFGIPWRNPVSNFSETNDDIHFVTVFPEFHPRSHLFNKQTKFIGSCISEKARSIQEINESIKNLMNILKPINPLPLVENLFLSDEHSKKNEPKLIYVSLGTVFNYSLEIFDKIIEAVQTLEDYKVSSSNFSNSFDIYIIFSLGKEIYKQYEIKINEGKLKLNDKIFLLEKAPQLEILKRASLFITHCGMNSISEAIQFGVPVICIPIAADQPRVAYRSADELGFGLRFEPSELKVNLLQNAIFEILNDKSYQERILRFSKISTYYNGSVLGAKIIIEQLEIENKKKN